MGHLYETPDLTMLPDAERPAVARALAKDPHDRWPSCREFVEALATGGPTTPYPRQPAPRSARRRWLAVALVGALMLLTASLPVVLIWMSQKPPAAPTCRRPNSPNLRRPPRKGR